MGQFSHGDVSMMCFNPTSNTSTHLFASPELYRFQLLSCNSYRGCNVGILGNLLVSFDLFFVVSIFDPEIVDEATLNLP